MESVALCTFPDLLDHCTGTFKLFKGVHIIGGSSCPCGWLCYELFIINSLNLINGCLNSSNLKLARGLLSSGYHSTVEPTCNFVERL